MDKLQAHLSKIRIPKSGDKVYKEECMFSFDSPDSETGLYVCLNTFLGWGKEYVSWYSERTGNHVFLHLHRTRKELPMEKESEPEKKIARLAIGVEGGFNPDAAKKKYEYTDHNVILILPDYDAIPLPNPDLPEIVQLSVSGIMSAESAIRLAELEATTGTWDGEVRQISKFAKDLVQLDNGVKVPPRGWKCEECDLVENLWLNLTDGKILCGRRFFDGSGGNNHAVDYYHEKGYPLAVKLGTITPDGKADVYSYKEDDMVEDPYLIQHLAHFGINVSDMEKADKTMAELEIDFNQRIGEWSQLQESGSQLVPRFEFPGLSNLGNSCYMNSVMQVLFTVPDFIQQYYSKKREIFTSSSLDPAQEFNVQMAKLAHGLLSGRYSRKPAGADDPSQDLNDLQPGIAPHTFRMLVGKGHPEFSTKRQQDAMDFILHLFSIIQRNSRTFGDPTECFKFQVEEKRVCGESGKVKYQTREEKYLPLPVPMEAATNREEVEAYEARKAQAEANKETFTEDLVRAKIPFDACMTTFASPVELEMFSTAVDRKVQGQQITRLRTFPDFLIIQLAKFRLDQNLVPRKLDVSINMPEHLDLASLRGYGIQPGEEELPEPAQDKPGGIDVDAAVVAQLAEMGFPVEACRKAVFLTGNKGSEAAMNWVMEHMGDPDFAQPLVVPSAASAKSGFTPDEEGLSMLMAMGFTQDQARLALKQTNNSLERAADWIFSHQHELDSRLAAEAGEIAAVASNQGPTFRDGNSQYDLVAFISHMGQSTLVGHYVCHIKKEHGGWTIFNDNKVCKSASPPIDLGYVYLYKRVSQ
ncbi:ubiquitin specific protease 5 [Oratosquilla oratoria]|uniref:ubiquitin specific protease 5 n=1 Tax=Oratosquilla oratoria TaxID=337810 RepID=UPI003F760364